MTEQDSLSRNENGNFFSSLPNQLSHSPSVFTYSQNGLEFGNSFLFLRGFDSRRISFFVNGIPQNDPEDHSMNWLYLPDFTANSSTISLGALDGTNPQSVSVNTMNPLQSEMKVRAGYGDYNSSVLGVQFNSGLIGNTYNISAYLSHLKSDTYRNASAVDKTSYSVSAERIDSNFNLKINLYGSSVNDGLSYYGIFPSVRNDRAYFTNVNDRRINWSETFLYQRRTPEHEIFFQPHYEVIATWQMNSNTKLTNTLFYIQGDGSIDYDGTWTSPNASEYFRLTPIYGFRYQFSGIKDTTLGNELIRSSVTEHQFGWKPQLEYQHDHGTLTLGAEFRIHRSNHWGQFISAEKLPAGFPDDYHFYDYKGGKDLFSASANEVLSISQNSTLSLGVELRDQTYRLFDEKPFYLDSTDASLRGLKKSGWTSYSFTVASTLLSPSLGFEYRPTNFLTLFTTGKITTREPRLKDYYNPEYFSIPNFARKADGSFDFTKPNIKPEHGFDFEVGSKIGEYLLEDGIIFSGGVTAYYMPYTEEMLYTNKRDAWGSPILGNAESVQHYGLELMGLLNFSKSVFLQLNATLSHNEIGKFDSFSDSVNITGKTPPASPSVIASANVEILPFAGVSFNLTEKYVGTMYGDVINSDQYKNDAYSFVDAGISFTQHSLLGMREITLRIQINNVFNSLYTSFVDRGVGFFVAAPRHGFATIQLGL
ncbi:MAG: TonB-dependent receptor plug domain-containing protein [bacterium]